MSRGDSWNTPHEIGELLARFWSWGVDLDPCANLGSVIPAGVRVFAPLTVEGAPTDAELEARGYVGKTLHRDGLAFDWPSAGSPATAYVNPPFSDPTPWAERCYRYGVEGTVEAVLCVPVQTSSSWWRAFVRPAAARCELDRRVAFLDDGVPVKGNPRDSALVYFGSDVWRFREIFRHVGEVRIS